LKAAVVAIREVSSKPIIAMMSFEKDGRTVLGTPPEVLATVLDAMDVDVVGANCSVGPEEIFNILKRMSSFTKKPLISQPNAGLPELCDDGSICYKAKPDDFISVMSEKIALGVKIFAGCCGTTPEHIKAIANELRRLKNLKVFKQNQKKERGTPSFCRVNIASRTIFKTIGGSKITIVGERINPTGKKFLSQDIIDGNFTLLKEEARKQLDAGVDALDINVGIGGEEKREVEFMRNAVAQVLPLEIPIFIDSRNTESIEEGLKMSDGKPIINSINASKSQMDSLFPLAKKYGAGAIALLMNERGIPETINDALKLAKLIKKRADKYGVEIIIDPVVLPVSVEKDRAKLTLNLIKRIREEIHTPTIIGLSNVSFGMQDRGVLNSTFLSMAINMGLDAVILNPMDKNLISILKAGSIICGREEAGERKKGGISTNKGDNILSTIAGIVVDGNEDTIIDFIEKAIAEKYEPIVISTEGIIRGLDVVGELFARKDIFLPQVLLSAETAKKGFSYLKQKMGKEKHSLSKNRKVLFATVEGDVHDIGKNIVILLLENNGFNVIDLGKNVPSEKIVKKAEDTKPDFVALSALMTTTMPAMEKVINSLRKKGIKCKVAVGGAVVTPDYAKKIGADIYARDAVEAVKKFKEAIIE